MAILILLIPDKTSTFVILYHVLFFLLLQQSLTCKLIQSICVGQGFKWLRNPCSHLQALMRSVITSRSRSSRCSVFFKSTSRNHNRLELSQPHQFSRRLIFHTSVSDDKRGSGINMILSRREGLICENDKLGVASISFVDVFIRQRQQSRCHLTVTKLASWHPPGRTLDANDRTWCTRISSCVWLSKIDLHTVGGCATALY